MDHDSNFDDDPFDIRRGSEVRRAKDPLTLALLEDLAVVFETHGFPPLRGYLLVEHTSSLYRLL